VTAAAPPPHPGDVTEDLERDAMAWPPARWERGESAWRDDIWDAPDPFVPYAGRPAELAPVAPPAARPSRQALAREVLETIILTAVIFFGIRLMVQNYKIEGKSMEPSLYNGQYLLVNKLPYRLGRDPERGDVVVFHAWGEDKDFIKRVIGLPGDEVEIRDPEVYVNDQRLQERYLDQGTTGSYGPIVLGADEYFVLGDNRGNSSDSRSHGPLPRDKIVGKAWLTYWPPDKMGLIPNSDRSYASEP
jgi:signal peptidase I